MPPLAAQQGGVDAEQRRHVVQDAGGKVIGAREGQDAFLHLSGQAGAGPQRPQHAGRLGIGACGLAACLVQHRRHVVGQDLAMHASRRRHPLVQVGLAGKPFRVVAQEACDGVGVRQVAVHAGFRLPGEPPGRRMRARSFPA